MDNFTVIYKILKALEQAMDYDEFDIGRISHTKLNISYERWEKIMIMLTKTGYIDEVVLVSDQCLSNCSLHIAKPITPMITLKGLEYLNDNTFMKKAANALKETKDVIPGL